MNMLTFSVSVLLSAIVMVLWVWLVWAKSSAIARRLETHRMNVIVVLNALVGAILGATSAVVIPEKDVLGMALYGAGMGLALTCLLALLTFYLGLDRDNY